MGKLQEALKKAGDTAIKINLKGKTLIPGFNDNHTHTLAAGSFYSEIILWNKTCEDIALIINEEAKKKKPGELITGNSWEPFTVRLLKKYRDSQELSCRFTCWPLGDSPLYYAFTWFTSFNNHDLWVRKGLVKYFSDG
ncbi:MAG TPA: amidohydrolase family protein, partial [Spirochaetota bacterium]|nr:amidohydrolase family protein [Spirochaetota bacterium]